MSVSLMTLQVAEDLGYDTSNGTADTGECVDGESQLSATSFQIRRKRAVTNYSYTTKEVTESDVQSEVVCICTSSKKNVIIFIEL